MRVGRNKKKKKNFLAFPWANWGYESFTGVKFRFKNIPAAKKKSEEEKELSQGCF